MRTLSLGYATLEGYLSNPEHYLGALIGRYANRIENSRIELKGVSYELDPNEGRHCLHGGSPGFHGRVWSIVNHGNHSLVLSRVSADGEGGFPGTLEVQAKYAIEEETALVIELTAVSDKTTVVNLSSTCTSIWPARTQGRSPIIDFNCAPAGSPRLTSN